MITPSCVILWEMFKWFCLMSILFILSVLSSLYMAKFDISFTFFMDLRMVFLKIFYTKI